MTVDIAGAFVKAGVQIVASLDKGINVASHLACRSAGGQSFAILESGFDNIYPSDSMAVAIDVAQDGGIVTEYMPDEKYAENNYQSSNRLIAGMAQAVVVTELYEDSQRTLDLLQCCSQIGKLAFIVIDPATGALADEVSLNKAVSYGAIPMVGLDKIDDIIKSLV